MTHEHSVENWGKIHGHGQGHHHLLHSVTFFVLIFLLNISDGSQQLESIERSSPLIPLTSVDT